MDGFVFVTSIPVSLSDVAGGGRVRPSKYIDYFLDALWAWMEVLQKDHGFVPQNATEARFEVSCPAPLMASPEEPRKDVIVGLRISRLGKSSCSFESEIRDGDTTVAVVQCASIIFDPETGSSIPISEPNRGIMVAAHEAAGVPIDA